MTAYQSIVKNHLVEIFNRGKLITDTVVLQSCEREFVTVLSLKYNYVPVFGVDMGDYTTFTGIKMYLPS